jgi:MerR family regulatory protein
MKRVAQHQLSIGEAANRLGVSIQTLRAWDASGAFVPEARTVGNQRRYSVAQVSAKAGLTPSALTVGYCRVSSKKQEADLVRQVEIVTAACARFGNHRVLSDIGSVALYLMVRRASEYLGCSRDELLAWLLEDRHMPGDCGPNSGARLWHRATLDAAKPYISAWRERDRAISAAAAERARQADAEASARRAGMRKGKAVTAKRACERLV